MGFRGWVIKDGNRGCPLEDGYERIGNRGWVKEDGKERMGNRKWVVEDEY